MFKELTMAPPDPILGLTEAFKKDPNPEKINLGVGVYKDESGKTPVFSAVGKAERRRCDEETTKSYLPINGDEEYGRLVREMVFGADHDVIQNNRAVTAYTPGGTGGLRVGGDLLKRVYRQNARLWVSDPTWSNHYGVFEAAGFEISTYPYYDADAKQLAFDRMLDAIKQIPKGDIILLHGCCHNPTGMDPTAEQWEQISDAAEERELIPFFDLAYQGFGEGLEQDAAGLRAFAKPGRDMLVASSYSKNFGLYRERAGALTLVADSSESAEKALSHLKKVIRTNYSNPPAHGSWIVTTVLNDPELRREWEEELRLVRNRIQSMRDVFVQTLKDKGVERDFSFIARQNGMFSFSGLTRDQVDRLRDEYSIYMVGSGRINVAGMTPSNMDRLCEAIKAVL